MQILPNLRLECDESFWREATALALKDVLKDWQPAQPTVVIIDELWGHAFGHFESKHEVRIVMTTNPCKEYWEDLFVRLRPNVLLVGKQTPQSLADAIRLAKPETMLKLTPAYQIDLTPKELEALHHLARIKTNKQIAVSMGISEGTARNHVGMVLKKLNFCGREEAMLYYWGMSEIAKNLRW